MSMYPERINDICHRNPYLKMEHILNDLSRDAFLAVWHWLGQYKFERDGPLVPYLEQNGKLKYLKKEKKKLLEFDNMTKSFKDFDLATLFKLIQVDCQQLADIDDQVWYGNVPEKRKKTLEYQLFMIKDGRNSFSHNDVDLRELSLEDFEEMKENTRLILHSIVFESGILVGIEDQVMGKVWDDINNNINQLWEDSNFDINYRPPPPELETDNYVPEIVDNDEEELGPMLTDFKELEISQILQECEDNTESGLPARAV